MRFLLSANWVRLQSTHELLELHVHAASVPHLRQRAEALLFDVPDEVRAAKLEALLDAQLGHTDLDEDELVRGDAQVVLHDDDAERRSGQLPVRHLWTERVRSGHMAAERTGLTDTYRQEGAYGRHIGRRGQIRHITTERGITISAKNQRG